MSNKSVFSNHTGTSGLFQRFLVTLEFREKIMGGTPRDPNMIEAWVRKNMGITREEEIKKIVLKTLEDLGAEHQETEEDWTQEQYDLAILRAAEQVAKEKNTVVFKFDDVGPFIEDRQIKALIKESTNILFAGTRWGATKKGPKNYVAERVFVNGLHNQNEPSRIYFEDENGEVIPEVSGKESFVGHVTGPQGPRSTLTYYEYMNKPRITFELKVVADKEDTLNMDAWAKLWTFAQENGLGALRSQSFGKFDVVAWEEISEVQPVKRGRRKKVA